MPRANCFSAPTVTLTIPKPFFDDAKKKAQLIALLRESLNDESRGIVNVRREKEIRKLLKEMR